MSRLTRDGTTEHVSRDQIPRRVRGQGNLHFPCSADHEQDWQPYPVGPYSSICDDHVYIVLTLCFHVPGLEERDRALQYCTKTHIFERRFIPNIGTSYSVAKCVTSLVGACRP